MATIKRLVNLDQRNPRFRYVNVRSRSSMQKGSRSWASCNQGISIQFLNTNRYYPTSGFYVSSGAVKWIVTAFAVFAFAPLSVSGLITGYSISQSGALVISTTSGMAGNFGLFFTGVMTALGFASPAVQTPAYANLNQPCADDPGFTQV